MTDVTDAAAVERLAAHAVATYGTIDTWVNNAGVAIAGKLEDLADAEARGVFDINFWGMVHDCKAALPPLKAGGGGVLVNIGSVTSHVAAPFMGLCSASKQAIGGYTDALRIELMMERSPVAVTLVKPAPIATPILEHQRNRMDRQATMPPPFYRPDDVAKTILHGAEHPERDLYVGGAGMIGSMLGQAFRTSPMRRRCWNHACSRPCSHATTGPTISMPQAFRRASLAARTAISRMRVSTPHCGQARRDTSRRRAPSAVCCCKAFAGAECFSRK